MGGQNILVMQTESQTDPDRPRAHEHLQSCAPGQTEGKCTIVGM